MTRLTNAYGIGRHLSVHPPINRFLESKEVDSTINPLRDTPSTTRPGSVAAGMDAQFLGQRGGGGGGQEPVLAQEEYQEVGTDVDLPF